MYYALPIICFSSPAAVCTNSLMALDSLAFNNMLLPVLSHFQLYLDAYNSLILADEAVGDVICRLGDASLSELYDGFKESGLVEAIGRVSGFIS